MVKFICIEGIWIFYCILLFFATAIVYHIPIRRLPWNSEKKVQTIHADIQLIINVKIIGSMRKINNPTKVGVKYSLKAFTLLCVSLTCWKIHKVESELTSALFATIFTSVCLSYIFITSRLLVVFLLLIKGLTPIARIIKEK